MVTLEETVSQQRKDIRMLQDLGRQLTQKLRRYHQFHLACVSLDAAYGRNEKDTHDAIDRIKAELGALRAGD